MYERKEMDFVGNDGSRIMQYDLLNAEPYYCPGSNNSATNEVVLDVFIKVADCILTELQDPEKATHNYLSCSEGNLAGDKQLKKNSLHT